MKISNKILITLILLSPSAHANFFKDTFDWAVNNPEYSIPAAVIGAPVALAATPMIVSYALWISAFVLTDNTKNVKVINILFIFLPLF
jgi:hypothetical protein